ncbi:FecR domain-containing protein [Spirosoma sp. SC4-14]|uniref:FecR family protein n=1 Tax=Spirosoma sp. SC4-14 TaxID=3128900 RepID=UPI0030D4B3B9
MKDYEKFRAEDLLIDPWFLAWVKHGQPEAQEFWDRWQQQHPDQRATILLAKDMAEALKNRPSSVTDKQVQAEVAQIMRLTRRSPESLTVTRIWRIWQRPVWQLAAAVVVILGIGGLLWKETSHRPEVAGRQPVSRSSPAPATGWVNQVNGTSQPVPITLPDGSHMRLAPNSQASYPQIFGKSKREVHLKGEAVFAVVHDSSRPFLVMSGPLITRVLGTRFRVRALPGDARITVSVQSGKVSVYNQQDLARSHPRHVRHVPGVVLTANQQVVYESDYAAYQKELVVQPSLITPNESRDQFTFQDTPVSSVFKQLEKGYGIPIIYDSSLFRQCTVTAKLSGVPFYDQLKLICASIGSTFEVVEAQIIVTGKGCQ